MRYPTFPARHLPVGALLLLGTLFSTALHAQSTATLASLDFSAERLERIGRVRREAVDSNRVPGVVTMMLRHGRIGQLGAPGWADPVSNWLPSFKRAGAATASDTGCVPTPVKRAITTRDLLTRTAGIAYGHGSLVCQDHVATGLGPDAGPGWQFADRTVPICEDVDRPGTLPFVAQPGGSSSTAMTAISSGAWWSGCPGSPCPTSSSRGSSGRS